MSSKITREETEAMMCNALDNFSAELRADGKRAKQQRRAMRHAPFTVTVPDIPGQPADHYEGE